MEITLNIVFKGNSAETRKLSVAKKLVGGRNSGDLPLSDPSCSRKHFSLELLNNGKLVVRDLLSSNGTFVNGQRISIAALRAGDEIRVGDTHIKLLGQAPITGRDEVVHGSAALFQCLPKEIQAVFEQSGFETPTAS